MPQSFCSPHGWHVGCLVAGMAKLALVAHLRWPLALVALAGCHRGPIVVELRQSQGEQAGYVGAAASVAPQEQCARATLCTGACADDDGECRRGCLTSISPPAAKLTRELLICGERHGCNGDATCARARCAAEVAACVGG